MSKKKYYLRPVSRIYANHPDFLINDAMVSIASDKNKRHIIRPVHQGFGKERVKFYTSMPAPANCVHRLYFSG